MQSTKITLVCDTECYVDYFLAMFRDINTGKTMAFEQYAGRTLDRKTVASILKRYRLVTFNGRTYDMPMLALALTGADCAMLKKASDWIILGNNKPWDFERKYQLTVPRWDHIDIIEVAPGQASLKLYGGRMHAQRMQDLPIEPDHCIDGGEPVTVAGEVITTPEQKRAALRLYCGNDLGNTQGLYVRLLPQIELRERLSKEYGQDLRSKSDAQIAEAVIRAKVSEIVGHRIERPTIEPGTSFHYQPPAFLTYTSDVMRDALSMVRKAKFVIADTGGVEMPEELAKARIKIGTGVYRMGIGGLHSSEQSTVHVADEHHMLLDRDVASYYPAIILNCGLAPKHMGEPFLMVYRDIVNRRLEAKRAGNKVDADSLKITINGSFGKLGSMWSALYSPDLLIQVTVTGQLSLLMLIERLEDAGLPVVSANTDGIVIKAPRKAQAGLASIIAEWERVTGFETEETRYRALFSRDVNNYVAIKEKGGVKTKGAYASPGLQKNPTSTVCVSAVTSFVEHGTPIEQTILRCRDIREFVNVRTVKGGALHGELGPDGDLYGAAYLGKVVRWYYGQNPRHQIVYRSNGNRVPKSEGSVPLMDLPFDFPTDVNHWRYVEEAYSMLSDLGVK